jgi:predicted GNAT family acetyltransferase
MGTSEEARGKGIGAILLKRCLKDIKESGLDQSIIPWVGPIGFYYEKVGAEVSRVFWNYSKEIKE